MRRSTAWWRVAAPALVVVAFVLIVPASALAASFHHALFVQTDRPSANKIVVYDRATDGSLTIAGVYATGGKGAVAKGAAVDPLASQGSLVTAEGGRVLLAVNAGSDTVSLFRISGGDRLSLRQVISSGGSFPVSIAVHGHLVYVLNAGGAGALEGYGLFGYHLSAIAGSHRSLGLANTTPPNFLTSPGQVGFSPGGGRLIVTTKASGSHIDIFSVGALGKLSKHPVKNASATPVPFAFVFDPAGRLVMIEAGASTLSTYTIGSTGHLTTIASTPDGQTAACWITMARGFYYVSNAGSANISAYSLNSSGAPVLSGVAATVQAGAIDSVATAGQHLLYVECGGAGTIDVFAVQTDGSLTAVQTVNALPVPFEGIALT